MVNIALPIGEYTLLVTLRDAEGREFAVMLSQSNYVTAHTPNVGGVTPTCLKHMES